MKRQGNSTVATYEGGSRDTISFARATIPVMSRIDKAMSSI